MSTNAADAQAFFLDTTARAERHFRIKAVLTTAGAVLTSTPSDPGVTITKNGGTTGQYDLTFPASPGDVYISGKPYSPAGTISDFYLKARSFSAGTASVVMVNPAGTAAYGASGDELYFDLWIDTRAA